MPLFERDRYQRLDGGGAGAARRPPASSSSSFCSSATIVVFVALCLVAAWMMASHNNIAVTVSPENGSSGAKDQDGPVVDAAQSDAPPASDEAPDTGRKDAVAGDEGDGGGGTQPTEESPDTTGKKDGGDASPTKDGAGDIGNKDDGTGGDAPQAKDEAGGDTGNNKGDGAGATTEPVTTDDNQSDVAGNSTASGTDADDSGGGGGAEGDTPSSRNQTFSDENGKSEGGEVAKPEDPDEQTEIDGNNATNTTTSGQDEEEKNADNNTAQEEPSTADENSPGVQANNSTNETPTESKETVGGDGGGPAKNQTSFDDTNGSDENASGEKVESTDDDVAPKNATSRGQNVAAVGDGANGNITDDEKKPAAGEGDLLPSGQAELLNETSPAAAANAAFPTQVAESRDEKSKSNNKKTKDQKSKEQGSTASETSTSTPTYSHHTWKLCNASTGADYIPCLDNEAALKKLRSTKHYEHRERHCPASPPTCLVPLPSGYRQPIPWPYSRDKIWYHNVPHTMLASYKGHQNWVKVSGEHLAFPGGGTQFPHGAPHYISVIADALPPDVLSWGRRSRVVLDVGCGVASFGGFLFDRDALTMSFAPKDEHEAQVQFALERGIPAVSAVMGTKRLPFPGNAFDVVHCARCRVPWHVDGGTLLIEVNRLLRPGGLFVWSATPVYRKVPEDVEIWQAMAKLTKAMCWEMVKRTSDTVDQTAMVVFKKPTSNECYDARPAHAQPPLCEDGDDQDAAWNVTLRACMHRVPTGASARGARWPAPWPERLTTTPYWLSADQPGVYGKPAPDDFAADTERWSEVAESSYGHGVGVDWKNVRNVMDMRAVYGGFAAALRDMKVWVMNVVTVDSADTLPVIYERGLFGMYHDWCESFSTYPRTYDLVHADHLFSKLKTRCKLLPVMAEVDRILRPEGKLIVHDDKATVEEVRSIARSLHWEVSMTVSKQGQELLCVSKTMWRPTQVEARS